MNQTEMLKRLEWSGILQEAFIHSATPCCPECRRIPDQGHTETCELNRLINQPQVDCPIVAGVSFQHEGPKETYILGSFYDNEGNSLIFSDVGDWEDRGDGNLFFRFNPSVFTKEKP